MNEYDCWKLEKTYREIHSESESSLILFISKRDLIMKRKEKKKTFNADCNQNKVYRKTKSSIINNEGQTNC